MDTPTALPFPFDQDLSGVLKRLDRRNPESRARLANDLVTKALLCAAMRLLERHLGPGAERHLMDADDERSIDRPALAFLTQQAVAEELTQNPDPLPKRGDTHLLRDRWATKSDFIADVLRFCLWSRHYVGRYEEQIAEEAERLIVGPDFVAAIHSVCYMDLCTLIDMPMYRLQLIASAWAEGDPVIRQAAADNYAEVNAVWQPIHKQAIEAHGLALREGLTFDDIAYILSAVAEGLALRSLADPEARVFDHEKRTSLFGTAALALVAGCTEPAESPSGVSLEGHVRSKVSPT
jgi:hypothetical protein